METFFPSKTGFARQGGWFVIQQVVYALLWIGILLFAGYYISRNTAVRDYDPVLRAVNNPTLTADQWQAAVPIIRDMVECREGILTFQGTPLEPLFPDGVARSVEIPQNVPLSAFGLPVRRIELQVRFNQSDFYSAWFDASVEDVVKAASLQQVAEKNLSNVREKERSFWDDVGYFRKIEKQGPLFKMNSYLTVKRPDLAVVNGQVALTCAI
jgi:hypothetical protein